MTSELDEEDNVSRNEPKAPANGTPWERGQALLVTRLGDHMDGTLTVVCSACGHEGTVSISEMAALDGEDCTLATLVRRLKCKVDRAPGLPAYVGLTKHGVTQTVHSSGWTAGTPPLLAGRRG